MPFSVGQLYLYQLQFALWKLNTAWQGLNWKREDVSISPCYTIFEWRIAKKLKSNGQIFDKTFSATDKYMQQKSFSQHCHNTPAQFENWSTPSFVQAGFHEWVKAEFRVHCQIISLGYRGWFSCPALKCVAESGPQIRWFQCFAAVPQHLNLWLIKVNCD